MAINTKTTKRNSKLSFLSIAEIGLSIIFLRGKKEKLCDAVGNFWFGQNMNKNNYILEESSADQYSAGSLKKIAIRPFCKTFKSHKWVLNHGSFIFYKI